LEDCEEGFRIALQYQIKEIFWKTDSQSTTPVEKNRINNVITQKNADPIHINLSGLKTYHKEMNGKIMRNEQKEEQFPKLPIHAQKEIILNFKYLEYFKLHKIANSVWNYFNSFGKGINLNSSGMINLIG
jgi:hypothetical protein